MLISSIDRRHADNYDITLCVDVSEPARNFRDKVFASQQIKCEGYSD
jgi:hypothetical protein